MIVILQRLRSVSGCFECFEKKKYTIFLLLLLLLSLFSLISLYLFLSLSLSICLSLSLTYLSNVLQIYKNVDLLKNQFWHEKISYFNQLRSYDYSFFIYINYKYFYYYVCLRTWKIMTYFVLYYYEVSYVYLKVTH